MRREVYVASHSREVKLLGKTVMYNEAYYIIADTERNNACKVPMSNIRNAKEK